MSDYFVGTSCEKEQKGGKFGVVIMFDGKCAHGGLTDRLRGITSVYSYCKEHGIPFYVHFVHPFSLEDYLEPNNVDWRISKERLSFNLHQAKPVILFDFDLHPALHETFMDKTIKQMNGQIHLYTNSKFRDKDFRCCFHELFRPCEKLQKSIEQHLEQLGTFVSVSFRFTTLLGDFEDCINTPLPVEEQEELISNCILAIEKIRGAKKGVNKILVTADSEKFLNRVKKLKYVYVVPGTIGHFDHSNEEQGDMELKTFLDFFLISHAAKVYLVRLGKMYNSGFCRHAAMLGDKPFECIVD